MCQIELQVGVTSVDILVTASEVAGGEVVGRVARVEPAVAPIDTQADGQGGSGKPGEAQSHVAAVVEKPARGAARNGVTAADRHRQWAIFGFARYRDHAPRWCTCCHGLCRWWWRSGGLRSAVVHCVAASLEARPERTSILFTA